LHLLVFIRHIVWPIVVWIAIWRT